MPRSRFFIGIFVLMFCAQAPLALADESGLSGDDSTETAGAEGQKDAEAAAKAAFTQATELFAEGRFDEAARKFNEAYALKPSWKLYYNIGQAEAAARRQGLAVEAFEKYLTEGGDEIPVARRDETLREVERLRLIVGAVELDAPTGYEVWVDGISRGTTPLVGRLRVSASQEHVIELRNSGQLVDSQKIIVAGQETISVRLGKGALPPPAAAPVAATVSEPVVTAPPAADLSRKYSRQARIFKITGWASLGAGGGMTLLGIVGALAARQQKISNDKISCSITDTDCEDDLQRKKADEQSLRDASIGLVILGGAAMIAAPVLLSISKKKKAKAEGAQTTLAPQIGDHFGGVLLRTTF